MTARPWLMLLAIGSALAAGAPGAAADEWMLAGNSEGLWLIQGPPTGATYHVLAKPSAKKWQWIGRDQTGTPAVAAAVGTDLHVLLVQPQGYLMFPLAGGESMTGANAVDKRWPGAAVPVAACAARDFAGAAGASLVVVVPRENRSVGTAGPAKADSGRAGEGASAPTTRRAVTTTLGVFQTAKGSWRHVTDLPGALADAGASVLVAVRGGRLYVLSSAADRARLAIWLDGNWRDVPLTGPASPHVLAMAVIDSRLVLVRRQMLKDPGGLEIVELDESGRAESIQPIVRGRTPSAWEATATPMIASLADQLALVWRDGDTLKFATCTLAGQLGPARQVEPPESDQKGIEILHYFLWALLGVTLVCSLVLRPRAPLGPLTLPETVSPGGLGKRLLAAIIDILPFAMVDVLVGLRHISEHEAPPASFFEALTAGYERMLSDVVGVYAIMAATVLYLAYCILMELRFGATVGKMVTGLQVVGEGGARPDLREVLVRNLVKVVIIRSGMAPLMLVVLFSRNRQRLGDMMARTAVVNVQRAPPPPGQDEQAGDRENGQDA